MNQPWTEAFARFVDANPDFAAFLERKVAEDFKPGDHMEYQAGYRSAWLDMYRWYKREVKDVELARFAARGRGRP